MLLDQPATARDLCNKALPIARAAGARQAEASILNTLIACIGSHENDTVMAIELMDQARAIAEELNLPEELLRAYMNGSDALDEAGRVEEALDLVLEGVEAARRIGLERYFGTPTAGRGRRAATAAPGTASSSRAWASNDVRAIVGAVLEQVDAGEYVFFTAPLYYAAIGAEADAADLARPLRDSNTIVAGERRAAELLERFDRQIARYVEHPVPPQVLAWRRMAAAEMSRLRGANDPAAWAVAAEAFEAIGQLPDGAHARYRQAEALAHTRAPREETRAALMRSRAVAAELGMTPLLVQIDGLARRARVKLGEGAEQQAPDAPAERANELGLTGRELEVLALVTQGCTNREIGERLYMSEKTASVHVSRILGKLGASNRAEAAASAERLGLVG
jgi:DNA-binding CsgD family transcriptional regulator